MDRGASFSDDEVREILRIAAERQDQADGAKLPSASALGLDRMVEIARDVGIEPSHVRAAAREVALRRTRPPVPTRFGIPRSIQLPRVLPGAVGDAEWESMVVELRRTFGQPGVASQYGGVREWMSGVSHGEASPVVVRLEAGPDSTVVTASQDLDTVSRLPGLLGGVFGAMALLLAVLFVVGEFATEPWILDAIFAAAAVLSAGGATVGGRHHAARQEERMAAALDRLELIHRTGPDAPEAGRDRPPA